jgi:hypothetical protein
MQVSQSVGISLPVSLLKRIDSERGDIPRSRFLLRLLQKMSHDNNVTYGDMVQKSQAVHRNDSVDKRMGIPQSTEPLIT